MNNTLKKTFIVKNPRKQNLFDLVHTFSFAIYIFTLFSLDLFKLDPTIQRISLYAFFGFSFSSLFFKRSRVSTQLLAWYGLFLLLAIFSFFYSESTDLFFWALKRMITAIIFMISLYVYIDTDSGEEKMMKLFILMGTLTGIYVLFTYEPQSSYARLGLDYGQNPNDVGLIYTIALMFSSRMVYKNKNRLLMLLISVLFIYIILLTGSKKAILGAIVYIFIYLVLQPKYIRKIKNMILLAIMISTLIVIMHNIHFFYNIIGYRLESFLSIFTGKGLYQTSSSNQRRFDMILEAINLLSNKPFLGVGLNNYAHYVGVYAHNNYMEVLANLGLIGFFVYYSIHFKIGIRLMFIYIKTKKEEIIFYISVLISVLLFDLSTVSYYNILVMIFMVFLINGIKRTPNLLEHKKTE